MTASRRTGCTHVGHSTVCFWSRLRIYRLQGVVDIFGCSSVDSAHHDSFLECIIQMLGLLMLPVLFFVQIDEVFVLLVQVLEIDSLIL
jgi:hypothetical protein